MHKINIVIKAKTNTKIWGVVVLIVCLKAVFCYHGKELNKTLLIKHC